ncbi:hypothetical protein Goshw_009589 [Gossypium schwendimanii]|uniref:Uncharacterized protein n=1 Tax=Gossypium schwendimanii TaxID=34291 RepID=A0A7J9L9P8_GOSSC|nr:hypothetical protein [Gossypium schwendimanii]
MEKGFLDKVKDNAAVRIWSEKTQQEKGDNLTEGYMSELWDFARINMTQNNLQEISTYSEHLPSIGILPIVASLLGR